MRKITKVLLALTLFFNYFAFGQTITVTPTSVGNSSISNGAPINLGTTAASDVALSVSMKLPSPTESDSNPGTIDIYYQRNSSYPPQVAQGGYGGALFFGGGTFAVRGFVVTLQGAQFDATGGYLYAQYKTSTGIIYKSANIPIIKNSTIPSGGTIPPQNPTTGNPKQIVPFGGIPILSDIKLENSTFMSEKWQEIVPFHYQVLRDRTKLYIPEQFVDVINPEDIVYSNKKLIINRTYLITNSTVTANTQVKYGLMEIYCNNFFPDPNNIRNSYYLVNQINQNQYILLGQNPTTIIGNQASETHNAGGRGELIPVTTLYNNYQWQSRILKFDKLYLQDFNYQNSVYGWKDIAGATQANYTPLSAPYGIEYRRLVLKTPNSPDNTSRISATSNIVGVYPIVDNNVSGISICCNQMFNNSTINPIIGDLRHINDLYKWQISDDGIIWQNILNANLKDYQPLLNDLYYRGGGGRDGSNYKSKFFRRITIAPKTDYQFCLYYISNTIKITVNNTAKTSRDKTILNNVVEDAILLSPNPSSSFLKVESKYDLTSSKVTIVDLSGKILELQSEINKESNTLQIDISKLSSGVYSLIIDNADGKQAKKFIKE